mmetsp:Transcript_10840/g.15280  ORF Transcript_10840/g.15280 Transcript_10840/m.15280 type:complete len:690 (+) Transcript_10840:1-2070(+)
MNQRSAACNYRHSHGSLMISSGGGNSDSNSFQRFMTSSSDGDNNSNNNSNNKNENHNEIKKQGDNSNVDNKSENLEVKKPAEITTMTDSQFERAVLRERKKNEIESILSMPDPPFDISLELKKVTNGISPPLSPETEAMELQTEHKLHFIETAMHNASHHGDFDAAQQYKLQLNKIHIDDCGAVLQVNSKFYDAFSRKSYEDMEKLWLADAGSLCIHPCNPPLVGINAVLKSWKSMFASENLTFQQNRMNPTNIRLTVKGTTAIITCDEEVYTRRFVRGRKRIDDTNIKQPLNLLSSPRARGQGGGDTKDNASSLDDEDDDGTNYSDPRLRGMELVNRLTATNIFRKVGTKWYLSHHHSSWHAESEAAQSAMNAQLNPGKAGSSKLSKRKSNSNNNNNNNNKGITAESILGIPGNEGLGGKKKLQGDKDKDGDGPKRIIMGAGSLSDLLGGGLGDLLGGMDDDDDANNDDDGNEGPSQTIIHFTNDDDDDDDDDDDNDEINIIQNLPNGNGFGTDGIITRTVIVGDPNTNVQPPNSHIHSVIPNNQMNNNNNNNNMFVNGAPTVSMNNNKNNNFNNNFTNSSDPKSSPIPKDIMRQGCITALRNLARKGTISNKHKRMLITDIIVCSTRGDYSTIEVAYELLCGEEGVTSADGFGELANQEAEEDFAEQCKVFASSLPEIPIPIENSSR